MGCFHTVSGLLTRDPIFFPVVSPIILAPDLSPLPGFCFVIHPGLLRMTNSYAVSFPSALLVGDGPPAHVVRTIFLRSCLDTSLQSFPEFFCGPFFPLLEAGLVSLLTL